MNVEPCPGFNRDLSRLYDPDARRRVASAIADLEMATSITETIGNSNRITERYWSFKTLIESFTYCLVVECLEFTAEEGWTFSTGIPTGFADPSEG